MMKKSKTFLWIAILASLSLVVSYLTAEKETLVEDSGSRPTDISEYLLNKVYRDQWSLPKKLHEVSGIAVVDNENILIHHDEAAVVFGFNVDTQLVVALFQLAEPVLKIDVEGIALLQNDVYLITSTGEIYKVPDGLNRTGIVEDYEVFDTGLADVCEIEGLDEDLLAGSLTLVCKQMLDKDADYISVYRFTPATSETDKLFDISFSRIGEPVHATAITTQFGDYVVLFGKEKLLAQISATGSILAIQSLKKKHHPQSEGLGFFKDGRLVLADEGKKGKGRITVYRIMNDKPLL